MANTPSAGVRVDPALANAARERLGQPDLPLGVVVRTGLAVLAGLSVSDALRSAQARPGPKPRTGSAG
jgi:hypothetical protein